MVEIRRILCPIDFSDTSRQALGHAIALARWYGSQVTALHVFNPAVLLEPIVLVDFPDTFTLSGKDRESLQQQLRLWLEGAGAAGLKSDALVREGHPSRDILECAATLPADLIVMGTHGRGGFERLVLGSVAEKVLRKAPCPVLTVPPPVGSASMPPYKVLVCPIDFSESSLLALQFALSIAQESNARLIVLHVLDWPMDDDLLVAQFDAPEVRQQVEQQARARLERLVPKDVRNWCEPEMRVGHGKPYHQILETAETEGADLIVMGVRGRNALDQMLFGSTTNHVVRRASCPVLTLKHR